MIPTIRKPFLIKLLVVLVVLSASLFGIHHVQARRIPDALMAQATRATDNGKSDAAIHYLRQYLEFRPDDVNAQEQLAQLYKDRSSAISTDLLFLYEKILRNDPARHNIRREALTGALALGRYSDAETHASELLKHFPEEANLWEQRGIALGALQKPSEARQAFENAIKYDATAPAHYQEYAQYLWRELKKRDEAKLVLDRLVDALPHDAESYLTRSRFVSFLMTESDPERALSGVVPPGTSPEKIREAAGVVLGADLRKALDLDPENAEALLLLAEYLQKGRDILAARDCLADGIRIHPGNTKLIRSLAWLENNRGNIGSAVSVLEDGLNNVRDPLELLVPLGDLLVQLGETERTHEIIKRMEARKTPEGKMQLKYLRSRVAMREAKWAEAIDLLKSLRSDAINLPGLENQTNLLLAMCFQRQGNTAKEQEHLKILTNTDPNHLGGRVALAQSFLNEGKFNLAVSEYQKAAASQYVNPATVGNLLRLRAVLLRTDGKIAGQEWDAIENESRALATKFSPATSDAAMLRADLARTRGQLDRSMVILRDEIARRPGDAKLWSALALAVADYAGIPSGLSIVDEAQAATGDGPDIRLARASLYARDPARLRPINPIANLIDTWPEADQFRLLYGIVEIYDRIGDEAGVIRTYRRIAGRRPSDSAMWEALYERAAFIKDQKTMKDARTALAKLDKTGKSAALLDSWDILNERRASDAAAAYSRMVDHYTAMPDRADACVVLARLKSLAGDTAGAQDLFARAVRIEPTRFGPTQEWVVNLAQSKNTEKLNELLQRISRDYRWIGEPYQRAIKYAAARLDAEPARKLLDSSRIMAELEPGGLGWLAGCYKTGGFPEQCLATLERSVQAKQTTTEDWLRLLMFQAETKKPDAVKATHALARKKLPLPQYFALAASFADSGLAEKTWEPDITGESDRRIYAQARLSLKLSRYQRNEALDLLEVFLRENRLTPQDAAWARRNLAMLLAARGGTSDRKRAVQLLSERVGDIGETPDEKRATAAVLAGLSRNLEGEDRKAVLKRAIEILVEVSKETRDRRDAYLLVQLYRSANERTKAREILTNLIAQDQRNIDYLVVALQEASEPNDVKFAEDCARALMILYPNEYRAIQAVARFEAKQGRADRALVLADNFARTADLSPGDLNTRTARSAELLDELSRWPSIRGTATAGRMITSAVEKYENLFTSRPEAIISSSSLLAGDGRGDEAFSRIERFSKSLPMRVRVLAGLAVLRAGNASDRQYRIVREWIDAAKNQEPESLAILMHEAEWYTLKQDFPSAQKIYENILRIDDRSVVALNNLAWILAARPEASTRAEEYVERAVREIGLTGELLDTRARIRISSKQYEAAERDLSQAIALEKTPLRHFHMAIVRQNQTPSRKGEAIDLFRKAKNEGLDIKNIHPSDVPLFRAFEAELKK